MRKLVLAFGVGAVIAAWASDTVTVVLDFPLDTGAVPVAIEPQDGLEARYCVATAVSGFEFNSDGLFRGTLITIH